MIKMRPVDVNKTNEVQVWINLYEKRFGSDKQRKYNTNNDLNVGDKVRISVERVVFRKGYLPGWTEEIFVIIHKIDGGSNHPITVYKIRDLANEEIKGTFYGQELQKVFEADTYRIEKVLRKTKTCRGGNIILR